MRLLKKLKQLTSPQKEKLSTEDELVVHLGEAARELRIFKDLPCWQADLRLNQLIGEALTHIARGIAQIRDAEQRGL